MPGFYMECYTGLKWVKREYSLPQILSLVCQNVSMEVLLTGPIIQVKIPSHSGDWIERGSVERPTSNGEGFRGIQYSMSMVLDTRFHIWFIMTLYYKMRQILLQNATGILLQNPTKIYYNMRQVFYYKMRRFYYKMRQFTKCDVYYKLRQNIDQWLEKYYFILGKILAKRGVGEQVWFVPDTVVRSLGRCNTRKILQFLLT